MKSITRITFVDDAGQKFFGEGPVFRLTADCIWNSFRSSHKRHLILTGSRKSGKTTMLSRLFPHPLPGITTWAQPQYAVYLKENTTGNTTRIGFYDGSLPGNENQMVPCPEGFLGLGNAALKRCARTESEWISIDEIGYLETGCHDYCREIRTLMDQKRLIAAVRKQALPFLEELCRRNDVFLVDLDAPFGNTDCIIMASGLGKRFGGNKLMADFKGKPLIQWTLDTTKDIFSRRLVVTRHQSVEQLCRRQGIPVIYHQLPDRSDTIRLGLEALTQGTAGCTENYAENSAENCAENHATSCVFCPGDQPLLTSDTLASLALSGVNGQDLIWRTVWEDTAGLPVLFPSWTFPELMKLPKGKGGNVIIKKYPEQVRTLPVRDRYELYDIDRPEDLSFLAGL